MPTGQMTPLTAPAKKELELSLREALSLGHNRIGTEHVLLGLAREREGLGTQVLVNLDAGPEKVRNELMGCCRGQGAASHGTVLQLTSCRRRPIPIRGGCTGSLR